MPKSTPQGDCSLKGLRVQNQGHSPWILCICSSIKSLHFHQYCWPPPCLPSVASHSTLCFRCQFATSGALKASHHRINVGMSAIGLPCDILRNQEQHRSACLLRPLSTPLYPSPRTVRCLLSFLLSHPAEPWGGSRHTQLLSLLCMISILFQITL